MTAELCIGQVFRQSVPSAIAGDNVGVLLRGIKREYVDRGMFLGAPGQLRQSNCFTARLYVLTRAEGGRSKPLTTGYINMAHIDTWTMAACVNLPSDRQMAMPGDLLDSIEIVLRKPMVLNEGQRFVIRENQQTTLSGIVTEILPQTDKEIAGFNYVPKQSYVYETNASTVVKKRMQAKAAAAKASSQPTDKSKK